MLLTIRNQALKLTVDTLGAQIIGILGADGCEYLWQGDSKYWADQAPTLFPYIGRLWNNRYRYLGTEYPMSIHGFAAASEFQVTERSENALTLSLTHSDQTLASYPFPFRFSVTYRLTGRDIAVSYRVENPGEKTMPFGVGGHPGFRVPLEAGETFEDYRLEFSCPCQPDRVGFTPEVYLSGRDEAYPLENDRILPLRHDLFDEDAVILKNMAREVTLRSQISGRFVTVAYPDMPYLGIWHWPKTDAPYVCIAPWTSLPSRHGVIEEVSCKSDLIQLAPGKVWESTWTMTFGK